MPAPESVDACLAGFPDEVRPLLEQVRAAIHAGMPGATETIRYGMPAVMIADRYGLHFAGWKKHVGLYPVPLLPDPLETEVAPYRSAKDAVNLRYAQPLPLELVTRIAAAIVVQRLL